VPSWTSYGTLGALGVILAILEPYWGPAWGHLELSWDRFGAILGSYWGHLGVILAAVGHHRVILGNLGAISGGLGHFGPS
jgi:hypothetical protein